VRVFRALSVLLVVLLAVSGCRQGTPTAPASPLQSPLGTPLPPAPPLEVPTPRSGSGVVVGAATVQDVGIPMGGAEVFLGDHIGATEEVPLYGFDPEVAPHTVADAYGRFVFTEVPPGEYVIVFWTPFSSVMASDPVSGEPLVVSVMAGQTTEVGELTEPRP
jgi:hypothetical protein